MNRMLEDPAYSEVVRWGDQGDSFVVLEVWPFITHSAAVSPLVFSSFAMTTMKLMIGGTE